MSTDIFLRAENEPLPPLTFRMGTLESLISNDGKTYVNNTIEKNKGDIYIGAHTLSSKEVTIDGEAKNISYYAGGSLIINAGDDPLFITNPPGPLGLPLVGQGEQMMPRYSPTVSYLGIGCDPVLIPGTTDTFYGLTVCNKSLFCNNIVFGKVDDKASTNNFTIGNYNNASSQGAISATTLRFILASGNQTVSTIMNPQTFINGNYTHTTSLHSAQFVATADKITYISKRYNTAKALATTAQLSVNSTGFVFENTDYIESLTNKVTINKTSGIILQAQQKDKPVSTITMANGDIQISSSSVNISSNSGKILQTDPTNCFWWQGRDYAMIRQNNAGAGYYPLLSTKANQGNWQMGVCPDEDSHKDKLIFTYITDTNYTGKQNICTHVKFSEEGVVESRALKSDNYSTATPEDGNNITNLVAGTLYFKIIE